MDDVAELPDVAGPVLLPEELDGFFGEGLDGLSAVGGDPFGKMADELGNVVPPVLEVRDFDDYDAEVLGMRSQQAAAMSPGAR